MIVEVALGSDVLLLGALYALEQCGLLLTDAAALIEQQRYSTGAAVALLAREELGRHKILVDLWRRSIGGTPVTHRQVIEACDDHVAKQRRAQLSLTYRSQRGDQLDEILRDRNSTPFGSVEWKVADQKLRLLDDRRRKRQPMDRHEKRMRAFYVDLVEGDIWARPCDLDPPDCANEVVDALNDYMSAKDRIEQGVAVLNDDDQLANAIAALPRRPTFPPRPEVSLQAMLPPSKRTS